MTCSGDDNHTIGASKITLETILSDETDWGNMVIPGCCDHDHEADPRETLDNYKTMMKKMEELKVVKEEREICRDIGIPDKAIEKADKKFVQLAKEEEKRKEADKVLRMSYKTAFAIALHNFPEGLATFVAAVEDPKMGFVLAVAIAVHNVPEGLSVAVPLYYATGNRMKAFMWGTLSGCTELLAGILGWLVLANLFSEILYGVLFGFVAGMMVLISIRELLPTAHLYDPQDKYVTLSFIGGMMVMALSLILMVLV